MTGICYLCDAQGIVEVHHVMGGSYRQIADSYGLTVELCPACHRFIHSAKGTETRRQLQHDKQQEAMDKLGWNVNDWISVFSKSWL